MKSTVENLPGGVTLHLGDCLEILPTLQENSIDSVVCDPPYHLTSIVKRFGADNAAPCKVGKTGAYARASAGFMNKKWDGGDVAFRVETWAAIYRVLKPGAHLVAFGGTRTYHRMACAIEDAGFEIRDCLSWNFGSGFPKSHSIGKVLDAKEERCSCSSDLRSVRDNLDAAQSLSGGTEQNVRADLRQDKAKSKQDGAATDRTEDSLRDVWQTDPSCTVNSKNQQSGLLQRVVPIQDVRGSAETICGEREGETETRKGIEGGEQPSMEGRGNISPSPRQLSKRKIRSVPAEFQGNVEGGRLRDGTSTRDGGMGGATTHANGDSPPPRSQATEQSQDEPGTLARQSQPQVGRTWENCGRCGKPMVPDGLGTALKPAMELICLARKPLSEPTIAANVLKWGTGALNIDGCRIAYESESDKETALSGDAFKRKDTTDKQAWARPWMDDPEKVASINAAAKERAQNGRWPANVIHDGSPEVVEGFPESEDGVAVQRNGGGQKIGSLVYSGSDADLVRPDVGYGGSGSAARFFYTSKADADDRLGSKHPTVKPLDLMQWLVRLVTPPKGLALDPFAGTGTTGEASLREGMRAVLIEREEEYQNDIRRRMKLAVSSGIRERSWESAKARTKDKPVDAGPLFGGTD